MHTGDPYSHASFIGKLKEHKNIFLTDLDGTFATRASSLKELADRAAVRKLLATSGFVSGVVTARTPALTMSSSVYEASRAKGFAEPEPHCGFDMQGKRVYVPLEELPFLSQSLDWDMVAGMGSGVYPRNGHGYLIDWEYDDLLKYDYVKNHRPVEGYEPLPWRLAALGFLNDIAAWARAYYSVLEFGKNYQEGLSDVGPLPYRIQLNFKGCEGLEQMQRLRTAIRLARWDNHPVALRLVAVDESRPAKDPEQSTYTVYLMPWAGRKEKMINHFVSRSATAAGVGVRDLRLFYAGDTPTDLRAGLWAGNDTPLTFLLATGSLLAPYLIERRQHYGALTLDFLSHLRETNEKGVYTFRVATRSWTNKIIIGDERYPRTTPPGSVLAFLEEFAISTAGQ